MSERDDGTGAVVGVRGGGSVWILKSVAIFQLINTFSMSFIESHKSNSGQYSRLFTWQIYAVCDKLLYHM